MNRILAIEPAGFHSSLNGFLLRCLRTIGRVTFIAPAGYLESCPVDRRLDIPAPLLRHTTKLGARWSGMCVLQFIRENTCLDHYDAIVLLSYETIALFARWPRNRKVFLFDHNNIDNIRGSRIKSFCYRHLPRRAVHLAFQPHIAQHIRDTWGHRALLIPLPNCRCDVTDAGDCPPAIASPRARGRTLIFSPSDSTPRPFLDRLKTLAVASCGAYCVICKGAREEKTAAFETRPFFDDYDQLMRECDIVFLGMRFHYRVSGVAFEALSYGKPVVLLDSPFARVLSAEYPALVLPVDDVNDIPRVILDREKMNQDHKRFLREHSFNAVRDAMTQALAMSEDERTYSVSQGMHRRGDLIKSLAIRRVSSVL
jgi:hypothetical protein